MRSQLFFETTSLTELKERGLYYEPDGGSAAAPESSPKAAVLVVDDERIIADTMVLILNANGFRATAAYEAQSALQLVRTAPPQILITDVVMPGMNGVQLAITVQNAWPQCRILLLSGNTMTHELVEAARQTGYEFDFLSKPVHPDTLLQRLSALRLTDEAA